MKLPFSSIHLSIGWLLLIPFLALLNAAGLIDCPDCKKPVSSRAVHCPNCGCPGYAIAEEALRIAEMRRPKPVLHVITPSKEGLAIATTMRKQNFVVMDEELLGRLDSLTIMLHDRSANLDYQGMEIALDQPLARFQISSDKVAFLPDSEGKGEMGIGSVTKYILENAKSAVNSTTGAIAKLDLRGRLVEIRTKSQGFVPCDSTLEWVPVRPSEYRSQAVFLKKLEVGELPLKNHRQELSGTKWQSKYLKNKANRLLATNIENP